MESLKLENGMYIWVIIINFKKFKLNWIIIRMVLEKFTILFKTLFLMVFFFTIPLNANSNDILKILLNDGGKLIFINALEHDLLITLEKKIICKSQFAIIKILGLPRFEYWIDMDFFLSSSET